MDLHAAAGQGDQAEFERLLAKCSINPDYIDTNGRTLLSWAAGNGHEATVRQLLAQDKIDLNSKDNNGRTPLSWAAGMGREAVVELLLSEDGIDLNSQDKNGRTPLSHAVGNGRITTVELLVTKDDIDPNAKVTNSQTLLLWTAKNGNKAVMKILLAREGIDLNFKDKDGQTPLLWAVKKGHKAVVKLLLAKDSINLNAKDKNGRTPLLWAAIQGYKTIIEILLAKDGIDLNFKDKDGQTPLLWAMWIGHEAVVKLLLAKDGVNLGAKDKNGQTLLLWAAKRGYGAIIEILLAKDNINPNEKDEDGRTPLIWAAKKGHMAVVKLLLAKDNINPNEKDEDGRAPLIWAAKKGHMAVVKLLLAKDGINPDEKDEDGRTPLIWAVWRKHKAVVKLLLAKDGINPDEKDEDGRTPLSWAAWIGQEAVVKLLLAKDGINPDEKDKDGQTPLSWAAKKGHKAVVKLLLAKGGSINPYANDNNSQTSLLWAIRIGREAVVKLLLAKYGINLDFKFEDSWTPLSLAEYLNLPRAQRVILAVVAYIVLNERQIYRYQKSLGQWIPQGLLDAAAVYFLISHGVLSPESISSVATLFATHIFLHAFVIFQTSDNTHSFFKISLLILETLAILWAIRSEHAIAKLKDHGGFMVTWRCRCNRRFKTHIPGTDKALAEAFLQEMTWNVKRDGPMNTHYFKSYWLQNLIWCFAPNWGWRSQGCDDLEDQRNIELRSQVSAPPNQQNSEEETLQTCSQATANPDNQDCNETVFVCIIDKTSGSWRLSHAKLQRNCKNKDEHSRNMDPRILEGRDELGENECANSSGMDKSLFLALRKKLLRKRVSQPWRWLSPKRLSGFEFWEFNLYHAKKLVNRVEKDRFPYEPMRLEAEGSPTSHNRHSSNEWEYVEMHTAQLARYKLNLQTDYLLHLFWHPEDALPASPIWQGLPRRLRTKLICEGHPPKPGWGFSTEHEWDWVAFTLLMCPFILAGFVIATALCIHYQWPVSAGVTLALGPLTIISFINTMLNNVMKQRELSK